MPQIYNPNEDFSACSSISGTGTSNGKNSNQKGSGGRLSKKAFYSSTLLQSLNWKLIGQHPHKHRNRKHSRGQEPTSISLRYFEKGNNDNSPSGIRQSDQGDGCGNPGADLEEDDEVDSRPLELQMDHHNQHQNKSGSRSRSDRKPESYAAKKSYSCFNLANQSHPNNTNNTVINNNAHTSKSRKDKESVREKENAVRKVSHGEMFKVTATTSNKSVSSSSNIEQLKTQQTRPLSSHPQPFGGSKGSRSAVTGGSAINLSSSSSSCFSSSGGGGRKSSNSMCSNQ